MADVIIPAAGVVPTVPVWFWPAAGAAVILLAVIGIQWLPDGENQKVKLNKEG